MPIHYCKIGKSVCDLLSDDFVEGTKLAAKVKTSNGVEFKTETGMKLSAKFSHPSGIKFNKLQLTEGGRLVVDSEYDGAYKGLLLKVVAEDQFFKSKKEGGGSFTAEFKGDGFTADTKLDIISLGLKSAATFDYEGLTVGAQLCYDASSVGDYGLAAAYKVDATDLTAKFCSKGNTVGASVNHSVDKDTTAVLCASYGLDKEAVKVEAGVELALDNKVTLKTKVNQDGDAALTLIQTVLPSVKLITSAALNVCDPTSAAPTFGVSATIG